MPPIGVRQVPDESILFRRIRPDQVIFDNNLQRHRPSSAAFKDPEMSVDIGSMLPEFALNSSFCLREQPDHLLARFGAKFARDLQLTVEHVPLDENPVHGEVRGKKTGSISNKLAVIAEWEVAPKDS